MAVQWLGEETAASSWLSCKSVTSLNLMDDCVVNTKNKKSMCRVLGPRCGCGGMSAGCWHECRLVTLAAVGPRRGADSPAALVRVFLGCPFTILFLLLPRVELCTPTCCLSLDCKQQTATLVTCKPKAYNTPLLVRMHKQLPAPAVVTALSRLRATPAVHSLHSQL